MPMTGSSFTLHPIQAAAGGIALTSTSATAGPPTAGTSTHHFSFDDFLDIVNPLQHLPVIGTIYRAITHDTIDTPEKIIGDTLYGGVMGLASSVADTLFEKATGHNFGDTVLALVFGHHDEKPVAVANSGQASKAVTSAQPAPTSAPTSAAAPQPISSNEVALTQSLARFGANSEMTQRAIYAYRRTTSTPDQAATSPF
ncbi:MAG: hypothetical protein WDM89_09360 [Rhizomicrobium sp.]